MGRPARAGLEGKLPDEIRQALGAPRASGVGRRTWFPQRPSRRGAPRERGWKDEVRALGNHSTGRPARAGLEGFDYRRLDRPDRAPRASGVGRGLPRRYGYRLGGAPRERGWKAQPSAAHGRRPGRPARAGLEGSRVSVNRSRQRAPLKRSRKGLLGAPRERGWKALPVGAIGATRGRPARAGLEGCSCRSMSHGQWAPRASGVGREEADRTGTFRQGAPRKWGWKG